MIHYLAVKPKPLRAFLESAGRGLADRVRLVSYEELFAARSPPAGAWLFTDIERLTRRQRRRAARAWEALERRPGVRLLNHPTRVLRRYALLRTLRARGHNRFAVHPAWHVPRDARFPLFLRAANDHRGPASPLLHGRAELRRALWRHARRHRLAPSALAPLVAVEFLDTADAEGIYRKYSCFVVDGAVVPRHVFFARHWMIKHPELVDDAHLAEEMAYLRGSPHEAQVRSLFALARIDYGRVDYALHRGRIQVWEINTNPMLTTPADVGGPRAAVLPAFAGRMLPALEALAGAPPLPNSGRARYAAPGLPTEGT